MTGYLSLGVECINFRFLGGGIERVPTLLQSGVTALHHGRVQGALLTDPELQRARNGAAKSCCYESRLNQRSMSATLTTAWNWTASLS